MSLKHAMEPACVGYTPELPENQIPPKWVNLTYL